MQGDYSEVSRVFHTDLMILRIEPHYVTLKRKRSACILVKWSTFNFSIHQSCYENRKTAQKWQPSNWATLNYSDFTWAPCKTPATRSCVQQHVLLNIKKAISKPALLDLCEGSPHRGPMTRKCFKVMSASYIRHSFKYTCRFVLFVLG